MAASAQPLGLRLRVVSDSLLFVALVPLCILNALLLGYLLLIARDPDTIAHDCNHRPSCIAASDQSWTDPTLLLLVFGVLGPIFLLAVWYRGESRSIAPLVASVVIAAVPLPYLFGFRF
jgi:hypothetical protein